MQFINNIIQWINENIQMLAAISSIFFVVFVFLNNKFDLTNEKCECEFKNNKIETPAYKDWFKQREIAKTEAEANKLETLDSKDWYWFKQRENAKAESNKLEIKKFLELLEEAEHKNHQLGFKPKSRAQNIIPSRSFRANNKPRFLR